MADSVSRVGHGPAAATSCVLARLRDAGAGAGRKGLEISRGAGAFTESVTGLRIRPGVIQRNPPAARAGGRWLRVLENPEAGAPCGSRKRKVG